MSLRKQPAGRGGWRRAAMVLLVLVLGWLPGLVAAQAPARPGRAAIAAAHPLAVAAGEEVLAAGGNAFDAAVAVSAALAVVEPYASGLGGGGFWLLHLADGQRDVFVDGREVAPAAATPTMYLDARGEVVKGASISGPLAAGIPGEPAALVHIAERYGRLPLARSLAPAVRLAEEGIPFHERLQMGLRFRRQAMEASPALMAVFYPGGEPPAGDSLLRQPDLARTLRSLGSKGFDGFYRGPVAVALVEGVRAAGGIWTLDDLAAYRVVEREPVRGQYRGLRLTSAPLPSAGGIGLVDMLNILAGYRLEQLEPAVRKHLLVEAMRRAYRDRSLYLGDPAYGKPPVEQLLSPFYAAGQRVSIRLDRATPSEVLAPGAAGGGAGADTTHFSILDAEGNRVAGTLSINTWFGAAFMPPGTGVLLNNEMDDFTIKPGVANAYELLGAPANDIAPGKRMLSSMTPTFLESGRGVAILGTPGGSRIITMVLLATLDWADGGDAHSMVALRRFHHQFHPDVVEYEAGAISEAEASTLEAMGHRLKPSARGYGNMNVVTWDYATGKVDAASDPRSAGEAQVY